MGTILQEGLGLRMFDDWYRMYYEAKAKTHSTLAIIKWDSLLWIDKNVVRSQQRNMLMLIALVFWQAELSFYPFYHVFILQLGNVMLLGAVCCFFFEVILTTPVCDYYLLSKLKVKHLHGTHFLENGTRGEMVTVDVTMANSIFINCFSLFDLPDSFNILTSTYRSYFY